MGLTDMQEGQREEGSRALFVTGLPVVHHPLQEVLETLFSPFGAVKSVVLHQSQVNNRLSFKAVGALFCSFRLWGRNCLWKSESPSWSLCHKHLSVVAASAT